MINGWSIIEGVLPNGLTLNPDTGKITGTPTEFGEFIFTVKIINDCGENEKEITIIVCAKPEITSDNNIDFVMGDVSSFQLTSFGTQGTWSISSGSLPTGLSLNSTTGIISGIPTVFGNFIFTVKVENDCDEATQEIDMFVCAKPEITNNDEVDFVMGDVSSFQLTSFGTQGTWSILSGSLPTGLSLNSTTGLISGTPTVFGDFIFTVKVTNDCGEATQEIDMFVCAKPEVTSSPDIDFIMEESNSYQLTSFGTPGLWYIVSGTLPNGVTLNSTTGVISGNPTERGNFVFTIEVVNPCGEATQEIDMYVCQKPGIVTFPYLHFVMKPETFTQQLESSGTPGTWSVTGGALPTGITLSSSGELSGSSEVYGDYYATITITNSCGSASREFHFKIEDTHKLIFTVSDLKTNDPITDAVVIVLLDDQGNTVQLDDNGDGSYETILVDGEYNYTVSKDGYYTETGTVVIDGDEAEDVYVHIKLQSIIHLLTFTVVDQDGVPVTDATIVCKDEDNNTLTLTNNGNGTYQTEVLDGEYTYAVSKEDYITVTGGVTINRGDKNVDVVLIKEWFIITFTVRNDETNALITDATIVCKDEDDNNITITNNGNGTYQTKVKNGEYDYNVSKQDFYPVNGSVIVFDDDENVEIRLKRSLHILTFTVVDDATDNPINDATIVLKDSDNTTISITNNGDGTYQTSVYDGTYTYNVSKEDYYPVDGSVIIDKSDKNVNVRLVSAIHLLTFTVVDEADVPVTDATVVVKDGDNNTLTITNNGDGTYETSIYDGTYTYSVSKERYVTVTGSVVIDKADKNVDVVLIRDVFFLTFTVKYENGNVVSDATIIVKDEDNNNITVTNKGNGNYGTEVYDGTYTYSVSKQDYITVTGTVIIDGDDEHVDVILIEDTYLLTLKITEGGGDYHYQSYDESFKISGQPIVDANVTATGTTLTNNIDGTYDSKVLKGTYPYTIRKPGFITHTGNATIVNTDVVIPVTIMPLVGVITIPDNQIVALNDVAVTATCTVSPPASLYAKTYRYTWTIRDKATNSVIQNNAEGTSNTYTHNLNAANFRGREMEIHCTVRDSNLVDAISYICPPVSIWRYPALSATLTINSLSNTATTPVNMWIESNNTFTLVAGQSGGVSPYEYRFEIRIENTIIYSITQSSNTLIYEPTVQGLHIARCVVRSVGMPFDFPGVSSATSPDRFCQAVLPITAQLTPTTQTIIEDTSTTGIVTCLTQGGLPNTIQYQWEVRREYDNAVMLARPANWDTVHSNALPNINQSISPAPVFDTNLEYKATVRCWVRSSATGFTTPETEADPKAPNTLTTITIKRPPFNWKHSDDNPENEATWMGITIEQHSSQWKPGATLTVSINTVGGTPPVLFNRRIIKGNYPNHTTTIPSGDIITNFATSNFSNSTFTFTWPVGMIGGENAINVEHITIGCRAVDNKNRMLERNVVLTNVMYNQLMGIIEPILTNGGTLDPVTNLPLLGPETGGSPGQGFQPGVDETRQYRVTQYGGVPTVYYDWKVYNDETNELLHTFQQTFGNNNTVNWKIPTSLAQFESRLEIA